MSNSARSDACPRPTLCGPNVVQCHSDARPRPTPGLWGGGFQSLAVFEPTPGALLINSTAYGHEAVWAVRSSPLLKDGLGPLVRILVRPSKLLGTLVLMRGRAKFSRAPPRVTLPRFTRWGIVCQSLVAAHAPPRRSTSPPPVLRRRPAACSRAAPSWPSLLAAAARPTGAPRYHFPRAF